MDSEASKSLKGQRNIHCIGIKQLKSLEDINKEDNSVVCRYISNPVLINGFKIDLRIYVVVTSFSPLKIYVFNEGITRFASEKYTNTENFENKFIHLTNYSVNKQNINFIHNRVALLFSQQMKMIMDINGP
jgi:Tubulin-tyrosine ligase family